MSVADAAERRRALDVGGSFIVQAPAGSGKTELLVRRFLALLAGASRPESVVAITFTRKAAGEMRARILTALGDSAAAPRPAEPFEAERYDLARAVIDRSEKEGWGLLDNPTRLRIFTIDGLCARLAASMPLLSRFGAVPAAGEDAERLYREATRRALAGTGVAGTAESLAALVERYEMRVSALEEQIVYMLGRRDQWTQAALTAAGERADELLARVERGFHAAMLRDLAALDELFPASLRERVREVATLTRRELQADGKECQWPSLAEGATFDTSVDAIPAWDEARRLLLTRDGDGFRKPRGINKRQGAPKDSRAKELYVSLLEDLRSLPERECERLRIALANVEELPRHAAFESEGRTALLAFFEILLAAHAELWNVFRDEGQVDFVEVQARALAALEDADSPSVLLERLDRSLEHLLVDEFQDTNLTQCRLIDLLTSGWSEGDGRTLFLVGDPMQSIYRFRKAEVGLFIEARGRGRVFHNVRLEPVALSVNFRSGAGIIEWVNRTFEPLLGTTEDAAAGVVAYSQSVPSPEAPVGEPVHVALWNEAPAAGGASEAAGLARLIRDELLPEAEQREGKVAVLVRNRRHALPLMQAMRRLETRYRAPGMDWLAERAVIYDLQALTRFLVHAGDRLSGLAVLRAPMVGLSLADLCRLVEPNVAAVRREEERTQFATVTALLGDEKLLAELSEDGRKRAVRCHGVVAAARDELGRRPLDEVVRGAWLALGGPHCTDRTGHLDAERFFGLIAGSEDAGGIDLDDLDRRLSLLEANADPDPSIGVEFLTIHRAKGLEFDTVVLPRLAAASGRRDSEPLVFETDGKTGLIDMVAPIKARGRESEDDRKHALLERREHERERAEMLRLLYVAATRAERRLVLSASAVMDEEGDVARPRSGSLMARLWQVVAGEAAMQPPPALLPDDDRRGDENVRVVAGFRAQAARAPVDVRSVSTRRPSGLDESPPVSLSKSLVPAQVGDVTHAFLERIATDGPEAWSAAGIDGESARIEAALRARGVPPDKLSQATAEVSAGLFNALDDDKGRWVLGPHPEARCEWKLTSLMDDRLIDRRIDRTFVEDGVRWIIDYKTGHWTASNPDYAGLGEEDAARRYIEKHQEDRLQLEEYATLISHPGARLPGVEPDRPIMLALFFLRLPAGCRWKEWEYRADKSIA